MARRYQSSLAVLSPGTSEARAITSSQLAETLSSFRRTVSGFASNAAARRGAVAGGQVQGTPELRSNATAFGRSYNDAALRNYVIEHYVSAEQSLAGLEADAGSDPDKFRALADGARKGAMQAAIPAARGDINEVYQRRIAEGVTRLTQKRITEQHEMNRATLQAGLDTVSDSISRKMTSGVPGLMAQAEEEELQYQLMVDGAVATGDITEAEGVQLRTQAAKRVTTQIVIGEFERQMREGDPIGFIGTVMTQSVENLSDEEKGPLVGQLFQRLSRYQSLVSEDAQLQDAEQKLRWAKGDREATVGVLRRQMTVGDITRMVERDELDPAVGRTLTNELQSPTRNVDDPTVLFAVETDLLRFTEAEIAEIDGLSHGTRADLILKRREESGTWKNDQGAQEALRRIDVALGIPSGLGPQFTFSLTEDKAKAASNARTFFYDLVEATPEAERKGKYFELANQAITELNRDVKRGELETAQQRLKAYTDAAGSPTDMSDDEKAEYDATLKRYNDRIGTLQGEINGR